VVVEVGVGDCHEVCGVREIDEAVVGVFADVFVAREIAVVDPDVGGLVDGDGITVGCEDLGDLQVPDDYVLLAQYGEADASES
jgi:hypothetical protein